jgi:GR25 family glycosyltransferase involved in LPS biosynthesis
MLSHLKVWKMIIEMEDVSDDTYFTIFEDDVVFHDQWNTLAPCFYLKTPRDFDILYMGNQMTLDDLKTTCKYIVQLPTYCNHAYIITKRGTHKLYHWILTREEGVYTIDETMHNHMKTEGKRDFIWYCWNALRVFPSKYLIELSEKCKTDFKLTNYLERCTGMIYQNYNFNSFVNEGSYLSDEILALAADIKEKIVPIDYAN